MNPDDINPSATPESTTPVVTFQGNSYDLMSVVSVTVGGVFVLTLLTCGLASYCLPFMPILLGIIGLASAKDSVDPDRTRLLSWLSIGAGGAVIAIFILIFGLYFGIIALAIAADSGGF